MKFFLIALPLILTSVTPGLTMEKMKGATNAAVSQGDPAKFFCQPLERQIYLNERGEAWSAAGPKARKMGSAFEFFADGDYADYLECFLVGQDVIAAYRYSNGEDGAVGVMRKKVDGKKSAWHMSILAVNLHPPKLDGSILTVPVDDAKITVDIAEGLATGSDTKGCVTVSRWPKKGQVHRQFGPTCAPPGKDGSVILKAGSPH